MMTLLAKLMLMAFLIMGFSFGSNLYACGSGCGCGGNIPTEVKVNAAQAVHACPGSCMCDMGKAGAAQVTQPGTNPVATPKI